MIKSFYMMQHGNYLVWSRKMPSIKKKSKIDVTSTLSPYLKEKMDRLVNEEKFSSVSDLISVAVTELLTRYPDKEVEA